MASELHPLGLVTIGLTPARSPAPAVDGHDVVSGRPVGHDQYRGRWVLVNFFATWCTGCRDEQPQVRRLTAEGGVSVLAVLHQDSVGAARAFATEHGGGWPVIDDPAGSIAQAYFVGGLPNSVLIAPNGTVEVVLLGAIRARDVDSIVNPRRGPTSSAHT